MICKKCGDKLIWGGDHPSYEIDSLLLNGVFTNYICINSKCDNTEIMIYTE